MCDAIYIGNTQQTFKKIMDSHFSDILSLLKNRQNSESFAVHFEQHFNATTSRTDLHKYMIGGSLIFQEILFGNIFLLIGHTYAKSPN